MLLGSYFLLRVTEPRYEGKRITEWWDEVYALIPGETELQFQARVSHYTNIVQSIGVSALPFYLSCLDYGTPPDWYDSTDDWVRGKTSERIHLPFAECRVWEAHEAIRILGPAAAPAIPKLSALLRKDTHCQVAALCLASIGVQAIPVLCDAATNGSSFRIREASLVGLGNIGTAAQSTSELLLRMTHDSAPRFGMADLSLRVLVEVKTNRSVLLPLFLERFAETNTANGAAYGLARLGKLGSPYLLQGITNSNEIIRCASMAALEMDFELWSRQPGASFYHFNSLFNLKCPGNRILIRSGNGARKLEVILQRCATNGIHEGKVVEEALGSVRRTLGQGSPRVFEQDPPLPARSR